MRACGYVLFSVLMFGAVLGLSILVFKQSLDIGFTTLFGSAIAGVGILMSLAFMAFGALVGVVALWMLYGKKDEKKEEKKHVE